LLQVRRIDHAPAEAVATAHGVTVALALELFDHAPVEELTVTLVAAPQELLLWSVPLFCDDHVIVPTLPLVFAVIVAAVPAMPGIKAQRRPRRH
jgi:hypothetical protein